MCFSSDTHFGLKWKTQLKILGILFNNNIPASCIEENWNRRIRKVEQIIAQWNRRNLSICGKICIIKTFLLSQFVYAMQALIAPADILKKLNTLLFKFLWKKKNTNTKAFEKVKRVVVCSSFEEGGLSMINIVDMQKSFVLSWVMKLMQPGFEKWKAFPQHTFSKFGKHLYCFKSNANSNLFVGSEN